jgi:hypothetical protein
MHQRILLAHPTNNPPLSFLASLLLIRLNPAIGRVHLDRQVEDFRGYLVL